MENTKDCKIDKDDPDCDCVIHLIYQSVGGYEVMKAVGLDFKKKLDKETNKESQKAIASAIASAIIGEATPLEQLRISMHFFASIYKEVFQNSRESMMISMLREALSSPIPPPNPTSKPN